VVGLMPHPEPAVSRLVGGEDGRRLLQNFVTAAVGAY
jgi:phosphoribosylformylglycinamidine (FGAM) synthase-like amidotransferase family enzyme